MFQFDHLTALPALLRHDTAVGGRERKNHLAAPGRGRKRQVGIQHPAREIILQRGRITHVHKMLPLPRIEVAVAPHAGGENFEVRHVPARGAFPPQAKKTRVPAKFRRERAFSFPPPFLSGFFLEAGRNFGETFFPVPDFFFKTKNYGKPIRTE